MNFQDDDIPGPTYANAPPKPRRSNDGYNSPGSDMLVYTLYIYALKMNYVLKIAYLNRTIFISDTTQITIF